MTHRQLRIILLFPAVICGALLFVGGPNQLAPTMFIKAWDLGHILVGLLWSWLIFEAWRPRRLTFRGVLVWGLGLTLLIGGGVELLQMGIPGRTASMLDLLSDLTGTLLTLFYLLPERLEWPMNYRRIGQAVVLLLVLVAVAPVARAALVDARAWSDFPVLTDFSAPFALDRWEGSAQRSLVAETAGVPSPSMDVRFGCERYSGIFLARMPRDWSDYKVLSLEFFLPDGTGLDLTCRINDAEHLDRGQEYADRFNLSLHLQPGWNYIDIPLEEVRQAPRGRDLDLSAIAGFGFFTVNLQEPRRLFVHAIRLR